MVRSIYLCFLLLYLPVLHSYAQQLPKALTERCAGLQQQDNLEEWIFTGLDYASDKPLERLDLLMQMPARAWRQPKDEHERAAWLDMLTYQGYYQMFAGNILPSITAYEAAYRYYNSAPVTGTDILEYILKPLGNNYTRLGDYERATYIHTKSLAIARSEGNARQIAAACSNLAVAYQMQERYDSALWYASEGLRSAPQGSSIAGLLFSTLADVYLKMGKADTASANAEQAVRLLRRPSVLKEENAGYWLASTLQGSGDIAFARHRYPDAARFFGEALQTMNTFYPGARKREKARLLEKSGRVALQLQQPADDFDKALALMIPHLPSGSWPKEEQLYGEFTLADAIEGKADALVREGRLKEALQGYQLIFSIERSLRREFFSRSTRLLHQKQNRQMAAKAMNTAYALWEQTRDTAYAAAMLDVMEKSKAQVLFEEQQFNIQNSRLQMKDSLLDRQKQLQQAMAYYDREQALRGRTAKDQREALAYELSQVQLQLKKKYPRFFETTSSAPAFLPTCPGKDLPGGLTVKDFFWGGDYLYVIDFDRKGITSVRRLPDAEEKQAFVHAFVAKFFQKGPQAMQNAPQEYYRDAYKIFQWLWNDSLTAKKYLLIPDGELGYIPFDALPVNPRYQRDVGKWAFLVKGAATGLAYSMQTWLQQQQGNKDTLAGMTGFFISKAKEGGELPAVREEYEAVSRHVQGQYFRNEAATLTAFREQLGSTGVLHLSTHASLQGDQQLPAIQLSDGPFFLFELYARRFRPGLVMLSACRTGQGMLAEGEGVISLAREFAATGATGIVAGLWNVHDATAARLTGDFYEQLPAAESPMAALHDAKIKWLGEAGQQLKLPYYWASLTYIGHHHPVILEKPAKPGWMRWYILAGIVALLAAFVRIRRR